MSCGDPHETPCSEVLEAVYLYLDHEHEHAEEGIPDRDHVRIHLDECGPCLKQYGLDKMVKTLVARHCGSDPVPEDFRERVLTRIQQVRIEIDQLEFRPE